MLHNILYSSIVKAFPRLPQLELENIVNERVDILRRKNCGLKRVEILKRKCGLDERVKILKRSCAFEKELCF